MRPRQGPTAAEPLDDSPRRADLRRLARRVQPSALWLKLAGVAALAVFAGLLVLRLADGSYAALHPRAYHGAMGAAALLALAWPVALFLRERALDREFAWLGALPFTVQGFIRTMGREASAQTFGRLTLRAKAPNPAQLPAPQTVASAIVDVDPSARVEDITTEGFVVRSKVFRSPQDALAWFHALTERVLNPLAEARVLQAVELTLE